jgi:hypothetical protein
MNLSLVDVCRMLNTLCALLHLSRLNLRPVTEAVIVVHPSIMCDHVILSFENI